MNAPGDSELLDLYRDLTEVERRAGWIRYGGRLRDGNAAPVIVNAFPRAITARLTSPDLCAAELERAAAAGSAAVPGPVAWGITGTGTLHVAFPRPEAIKPGTLSAAGVATLGTAIARALSAVHRGGMAHGAVDAGRIGWAADRQPLLIDLGVHGALRAGGLSAQDALGVLSETDSGRASARDDNDQRADVYSLGAALYELLTGKGPHGGRTTSYVMATVLPPSDDLSERSARVVVDALLRAIERAPDDRWPTADAFAGALAATGSGASTPAAREKRGCFLMAAAFAALAVAAASTLYA